MQTIWKTNGLSDIVEKVQTGERLSFEDGVRLMTTHDITTLGHLADEVRKKKIGENAYFYINMNVNPTNICVLHCQLCAFRRDGDEEDAYILDLDEFEQRVRTNAPNGLNEVHIVGGLYPRIPLTYYEDICRRVKKVDANICVHGFTAVEIDYIAKIEKMSYEEVLTRLKNAGLDNLPGGGSEIFAPRVRELICKGKIGAKEWFKVHETAHKLGMKTNATMLYGHVETPEERIDHLMQLRESQDRTGGYSCFIPLAFHPENTHIENVKLSDGFDDLRVIATGRLFLDNFLHVKAIWTYLGEKLAQTALMFGADDLHGTNVDEKIVHDAGAPVPTAVAQETLVRMIKDAGRVPVLTDSRYETMKVLN
jgi:aminodeoxyfutalosine synthase